MTTNTRENGFETLIKGGNIEAAIHEEITYKDMYGTGDNLWNFMYFTGYLKEVGRRTGEYGEIYMTLTIPNKELFLIYIPVIIPMTADAAMKAIGWIFLRGVYLIQTKAMAASMIAGQ